jgi:hypothetical protein
MIELLKEMWCSLKADVKAGKDAKAAYKRQRLWAEAYRLFPNNYNARMDWMEKNK